MGRAAPSETRRQLHLANRDCRERGHDHDVRLSVRGSVADHTAKTFAHSHDFMTPVIQTDVEFMQWSETP
jgi:hypothetical protein